MAEGSTPGNGKTSPFGNGNGNTSGGKVAGNNFLINPGGSGMTGTGRRFDNQQAKPQKLYEADSDINRQDAAPGDLIPKADAPARPDSDVGVGSIGDGRKPFTLNGG